jgi:hypothetical protein
LELHRFFLESKNKEKTAFFNRRAYKQLFDSFQQRATVSVNTIADLKRTDRGFSPLGIGRIKELDYTNSFLSSVYDPSSYANSLGDYERLIDLSLDSDFYTGARGDFHLYYDSPVYLGFGWPIDYEVTSNPFAINWKFSLAENESFTTTMQGEIDIAAFTLERGENMETNNLLRDGYSLENYPLVSRTDNLELYNFARRPVSFQEAIQTIAQNRKRYRLSPSHLDYYWYTYHAVSTTKNLEFLKNYPGGRGFFDAGLLNYYLDISNPQIRNLILRDTPYTDRLQPLNLELLESLYFLGVNGLSATDDIEFDEDDSIFDASDPFSLYFISTVSARLSRYDSYYPIEKIHKKNYYNCRGQS